MPFITATPFRHHYRTHHHRVNRRPRASATPQNLSTHSLDKLLDALRRNPPATSTTSQTVHLVGVGPGDPGLLTLSALRHMQTAEIVLYDRLITPQILSLVNPAATMVYVGKQSGFHTRTQHDIHLLLQFFASEGKKVVRLKGGDPLIFGRGGEEIAYLENRGIDATSVPGITAAAGIAADLGIPLTMRGVANAVKFLTGHARDDGETDIGAVEMDTTYVIYMGLGLLPKLVESFLERGLEVGTPAVAVERGTTTAQRAVATSLGELCQRVENACLRSPTLIFVGEVVRFSRVWGADRVVEGRRDQDFEHADVFGLSQKVLDRAFDVMDTPSTCAH